MTPGTRHIFLTIILSCFACLFLFIFISKFAILPALDPDFADNWSAKVGNEIRLRHTSENSFRLEDLYPKNLLLKNSHLKNLHPENMLC